MLNYFREFYCCLYHFSVAVIQYYDQEQLREERVAMSYGSRGGVLIGWEGTALWQDQEAERPHLYPYTGNRVRRRENRICGKAIHP